MRSILHASHIQATPTATLLHVIIASCFHNHSGRGWFAIIVVGVPRQSSYSNRNIGENLGRILLIRAISHHTLSPIPSLWERRYKITSALQIYTSHPLQGSRGVVKAGTGNLVRWSDLRHQLRCTWVVMLPSTFASARALQGKVTEKKE